ncbi:MAG: hypothetical protein HY961_12445 [Ignavibacteriae bacterium]|nr:hypothetical protein [Ignavibacteriota bacterium]
MKAKPDRRMVAKYWANMRKNDKNQAYYQAHKREFLKKYRNKYVAISNEQLIDVDADRIKLLDRVFERVGNEPFFYAQVTEKPRVVLVPSHSILRKVHSPR